MNPFVKKDVLLLLRDRKELVVLVLMPFALIAILGFALGGLIGGSYDALNMKIALVSEEDETEGLQRFVRELRQTSLPEEAKLALEEAAGELRPQMLLKNMLNSSRLAEWIGWSEMDGADARQALKQGEATAALIIPPDFTYKALSKMLLDRGEGTELRIEASATSPMRAIIFHDIVNQFVETLNVQTALGQTTGMMPDRHGGAAHGHGLGGVESVAKRDPANSFQYFTFGMAVMFVLFIASLTATRAYAEKQQRTYDRLMTAGANPLGYLGSKVVSAAVLAMLQLFVLFALASLLFQVFAGQPSAFWGALLAVSAALAICVGGLSALLTALSFRFHTSSLADLFGGMLVALLAFLGGSFFPSASFPEWLNVFGSWTPNGAALGSYLQALQGGGPGEWMSAVYRLLLLAAVLLAASVWIFPTRRLG